LPPDKIAPASAGKIDLSTFSFEEFLRFLLKVLCIFVIGKLFEPAIESNIAENLAKE
jgi:hypothetical protein